MWGFGGFRAFYYLQTLLTDDNETGRQTRPKFNSRPLQIMRSKQNLTTSSHFDKSVNQESLLTV
jgi:hypothetical protein